MSGVKNQREAPAVSAEQVSRLLERQVVATEVAPAATAGYIGTSAPAVIGAAGRLPRGASATPNTVFDLASVSKPIVACTVLRLVAARALALETPLGALLPVARGTPSASAPLELLLAHRAGLAAHLSLFAPVLAGAPLKRERALVQAASARRPECQGPAPAGGFPPTYSDLGYLLVGAALEATTNEPLDALVAREVASPLGLVGLGSARKLWRSSPSFPGRVAPTEVVPARGGLVRGAVHDENAWALSGYGTSGHAGLFGTALDVLGFGQALLAALRDEGSWLPRTAVARLIAPRPGGTLRAGFDGKSEGASSAGQRCSQSTFGHLGFTGTSLWCDPEAGIATTLLTNRVCPTRENAKIRAARPVVHDALFGAAKAVLPAPPNP